MQLGGGARLGGRGPLRLHEAGTGKRQDQSRAYTHAPLRHASPSPCACCRWNDGYANGTQPYNLANFLRTLALPGEVAQWSLTSLREKVVKIGAKVVAHGRYLVFQMAEVAVPQELFRRSSTGSPDCAHPP